MIEIDKLDPGGCPCNPEEPEYCACNSTERVLRLYSGGSLTMSALTPVQREECLAEIDLVEGYSRKDYEAVSDRDLTKGVLHAMTDYCRDKGLL